MKRQYSQRAQSLLSNPIATPLGFRSLYFNAAGILTKIDDNGLETPIEFLFELTDGRLGHNGETIAYLSDVIDATTASNGLTKTLDDIKLGGSLTEQTTIDTGGFAFGIGTTIGSTISLNTPMGPGITSIVLQHADASGANGLLISDIEFRILGTHVGFAGATYQNDYSANFTARSLVDKAYVDNLVGAGFTELTDGHIVYDNTGETIAYLSDVIPAEGLNATLAQGNTTGGYDIAISSGDAIIFDTSNGIYNGTNDWGRSGWNIDLFNSGDNLNFSLDGSQYFFDGGEAFFSSGVIAAWLGTKDLTSGFTGSVWADNNSLTYDRTYQVPDKNGTLALLDDVTTFTEITDGHLEYDGNTIAYLTDITDSTTASNGLTKTLDNITLGGSFTVVSLTGITVGSVFELNAETININNSAGFGISMGTYTNIQGSGNTHIEIGTGYQFNSYGYSVFRDWRAAGSGFEYFADYSANYTNRSLVDKEYVDGLAPATPSLEQVLSVDNSTEGNDIEMTTTDRILFAGGDSYIGLGTPDNDLQLFGEGGIKIQSGDGRTLTISDTFEFDGGIITLRSETPVIEFYEPYITDAKTSLTINPLTDTSYIVYLPHNKAGTLALTSEVTTFTEITDGHLDYDGNTIAYLSDVQAADTLAEVLALGNTTGGTAIYITNGDFIGFGGTSTIYEGTTDLVIQSNNNGKGILINATDEELVLASAQRITSQGSHYFDAEVHLNQGLYNGALTAPTFTANRTWTFPDVTGTIALTSDIIDPTGVYLLLAGGTMAGDIDMQANDLILDGSNFNAGRIYWNASNSIDVEYGSAMVIKADTEINLQGGNNAGIYTKISQDGLTINDGVQKTKIQLLTSGTESHIQLQNNTSTLQGIIKMTTIAAERTWTFPDATGTVALLSDIIDPSGVYLPLAGGTMTGNIYMGTNSIVLDSSSLIKSLGAILRIENNDGDINIQADGEIKLESGDGVVMNLSDVIDVNAPISYNDIDNYYNLYNTHLVFRSPAEAWGVTLSPEEGLLFTDELGSSVDKSSYGANNFFMRNNGFYAQYESVALTADRIIRFPDAEGTIALTGDLFGGTLADLTDVLLNTGEPTDGQILQFSSADDKWVAVDATGNALKQVGTITGSDAVATYVINHTLDTRDVIVQVYDANSPYDTKGVTVERTSTTSVTVKFAAATTIGDDYRVVIIG